MNDAVSATGSLKHIPRCLIQRKQWVLYKLRWNQKRGKYDKVPFQPSGSHASSTNSKTWTTFDHAKASFELLGEFYGLGIVLTKCDPFCGLDLDDCVDPENREITPWARTLLDKISKAYIEYSPSGRGLRAFFRGTLPPGRRRLKVESGTLEIYDDGRFLTVTGNVYQDPPETLTSEQSFIDELFDGDLFSSNNQLANDLILSTPLQGEEFLKSQIDETIEKAKRANNGEKFERLFTGDWTGYPSQSEADMAFCQMLAFWTDCNEIAMDQIFRESALYREKWERPDYMARTIRGAIEFQKSKPQEQFEKIEAHEDEPDGDGPLPLLQIASVLERPIEYLIDGLWLLDSVGFCSAQPKSCKTWLSLELGISVASGTKAFGHYQAKKGKVIAFNAEDDPARATKQRIKGFCNAKGIKLESLDFHLIDLPSLLIDDPSIQKRIEQTIIEERPALMILDPFFNLHGKDEDRSKELSPLLQFLRILSRKHQTSLMLICHDKKPSRGSPIRRASQARGSNSLEGWADNMIFLDDVKYQPDLTKIQITHRSGPPVAPFYFKRIIEGKNGHIIRAELEKLDEGDLIQAKESDVQDSITELLKSSKTPLGSEQIRERLGIRRNDVIQAINDLMSFGAISLVQDEKDKRKKKYRYQSLLGT